MGSDDTGKQQISLATAAIAAVLVFLALKLAAGFDTWLSIAAGLAVGAIGIVMRRRMSSKK